MAPTVSRKRLATWRPSRRPSSCRGDGRPYLSRRHGFLALLTALVGLGAGGEGAQIAVAPTAIEQADAKLPAGTVIPAGGATVVFILELGVDGVVEEASVHRGAGEPFDSAGLAAVRQYLFSAAKLADGTAVPVTLTFRLKFEPPPPPVEVPIEVAEGEAPPPVKLGLTLMQRGARKKMAGVGLTALAGGGAANEEGPGGEVLAEGITGEDGRALLQIPPGKFVVVGAPAGFERFELDFEAEPGEEREETIYVQPETGDPYRTVVRARRVRREVTQRTVPRRLIEKAPGTSGDALKVIQNLPGVARQPFDGGLIVLRGSNPGDSKTYLEGHEIPFIYHFGGLRSTFATRFLDSISFVPGNFSPDYGRSVGGIIDVKVRDPADDLFRGVVDVNLYDAGFAMEGPVNDELSVGGAFRRSYIDTILAAALPEDGDFTFDVAPRYYDYQVIATYKRKRGRTRIIGYGGLDKLRFLFDNPASDPAIRGQLQTRSMFHHLHLATEERLTPTVRQEVSLVTGIQTFDLELGPDFFFDIDSRFISFRAAWDVRLSDALTWRVGTDSRVFGFELFIRAPNPPKEGENPQQASLLEGRASRVNTSWYQPGAFTELRWRATERLTVMPGVRLDWYDAIDAGTVDPRLTAEYRVDDATRLRAGLGLYQQEPDPEESNPDFGNPELGPEQSIQASAGVDRELFEGVRLELTGFYKWLDQVIARRDDAASVVNDSTYTNGATGRVVGVETLLRADLPPRFIGWVAYTFQRSFRTDPGKKERFFDFDQPHILSALGSYEISSGWSLGVRYRFVSGNPDTPVLGGIFSTNEGAWAAIYGANNSTRLPNFHQVDVRVDKTWTWDLWKLTVYLDVQNATNRGNVEGWIYRYDFEPTQRQPITGLPVLPILGIQGEW